jgi:hypothetical protein
MSSKNIVKDQFIIGMKFAKSEIIINGYSEHAAFLHVCLFKPPGICKQNPCHAVNEGRKKCANQYFTICYEKNLNLSIWQKYTKCRINFIYRIKLVSLRSLLSLALNSLRAPS